MGRKVRIESDDVLIIHTAPIFQPLLAPASYKGSGSRNAPHSDAAPQPTPSSPHISHIDLPTFSLPQKKLDRDFKERGPRAEPLIPIAAIPPRPGGWDCCGISRRVRPRPHAAWWVCLSVQPVSWRIVLQYQLEMADTPPRGHFRRGDRFLGKAHALARALSRCSACNHLEIAAGNGHGWLWSVVAEAVVRACLTSI